MKKAKREVVCTACPLGCRLTITGDTESDLVITGNSCPRGLEYGREEFLSPKRVVTATASAEGNPHIRIPVKTGRAIPKGVIASALNRIYNLSIPLPVKTGDILLENLENTGVQLVATKTITKPGD